MKIKFICASLFMAGLSLSSCSSDNTIDRMPEDAAEHTLTFNLSLPAGEKVSYSRDIIHDAEEYAINTLTLYEYEVITGEDGSKTTSLARVMEYPNGTGKNTIDLKNTENNKYSFSIIVPAANDGKTYTYKFVANRNAGNKDLGSVFASTLEQQTNKWGSTTNVHGGSHLIANNNGGAAMSGTAMKDESDELVMTKGLTCEVSLVRCSARIDVKHSIPNLKITSVTLKNTNCGFYYFPQQPLPEFETIKTMRLNEAITLTDKYLNDPENTDTEVNLKKAFYVFERKNEEANTASVAIEYTVSANGKEYEGSIEVPFKSTTTGEYVDILRNHLYTIVLGNGDPISGKVTAKIVVDDWNAVDIDEPLTDDDNEVTNND